MSAGSNAVLDAPRVAATRTLTPVDDQTIKQVPVEVKKAVVFFIGGAADKESYYFQGPNNNIAAPKSTLDTDFENQRHAGIYASHYLDYSEARGWWDIDKYVLKEIPTRSVPVYIVGHSLGAWNGAHLSKILTDKGYRVEMLITLDPVGNGFWVWLGSDIYLSKPTPVASFWINVRAAAVHPNMSDSVAEFGERWIPEGTDIDIAADINHADADRMFTVTMLPNYSPHYYIKRSIEEYLGK
ncbi:alpha/beta hydrolase [Pseudomonas sp. PDNC002]|nr:alpha/beta hydrolase [Pseudomonas sp. PDNC002]